MLRFGLTGMVAAGRIEVSSQTGGNNMTTQIRLSNGFGMEPIEVADGMPHDELLDVMYQYAAEADAVMGDAITYDMQIVVRAWPHSRYRADEVVEVRHARQRYSAELVAALIAEDYR